MSTRPTRVDFSSGFLGVTGSDIAAITRGARGAPRIDGFTLGVWETSTPAPHGGEMHPDGDEFLFLLAGEVSIAFDGDAGEETLTLTAGEGCVVPRGVWHKVLPAGPCKILHLTPGPDISLRPPRQA